MIIDFHAHVGKGMEGSTDLLQTNIAPSCVIDCAKEAGIDKTVVFPVTYTAHRYDEANEEIAHAVEENPRSLIGFARIAMTNDAVKLLTRAVEELSLRGLKLHYACDGFSIRTRRLHEVLDAAGELGIPVIFHSIGIVPQLIKLAHRHTQTAIVFGHMGGLWNCDAIRLCIHAARELPNVYLETSGMLVSWLLDEAAITVPHKVLFGSDSPALHPSVELMKVRCLHLDPERERQILADNAMRLLSLTSQSPSQPTDLQEQKQP